MLALYDHLDAHAVTASPYLGRDALLPLLDRPERLVYVLCRTSNAGASELQGLELMADPAHGHPAEPLAVRIARLAAGWELHPGTVGLVVGATAPAELAAVRDVAPELPFLVPGIGRQGGDLASTLKEGPARAGSWAAFAGGGLLVNVSRGIAAAALDAADPEVAVAEAAATWAERLRV